jgi:hypothetical protein
MSPTRFIISPPMLSPGSETFGKSSITKILRRYVVGMFKIGCLISVRGFSLTDPPPFLLLVFVFRSPKTLKAYFLQDELVVKYTFPLFY